MSKDPLNVPRATTADIAYTLTRAGISSIPYVGNAAVEVFQMFLTPPLLKRQAKWMEAVVEGLRQLEEKQKCTLEDLGKNEQFIDTVLQASRAAIQTSQQEKIEALRNAVLNAALPHAPDESRRQMFLSWVEAFTVWHLRILRLLRDPARWFQENSRPVPSFMMGSLSTVLVAAYPELEKERPLYDQMIIDLHARGLLGLDSLHTTMSGGGLLAKRTTELGNEFLSFLTAPAIA